MENIKNSSGKFIYLWISWGILWTSPKIFSLESFSLGYFVCWKTGGTRSKLAMWNTFSIIFILESTEEKRQRREWKFSYVEYFGFYENKRKTCTFVCAEKTQNKKAKSEKKKKHDRGKKIPNSIQAITKSIFSQV